MSCCVSRKFMRTFSMYFALCRCMRIDQDRVGKTTSMYVNRPRLCLRNDLDVCESTCMRNNLYAKRPTSICPKRGQISNPSGTPIPKHGLRTSPIPHNSLATDNRFRFPIELKFRKISFGGGGKTGEPGEQPLEQE